MPNNNRGVSSQLKSNIANHGTSRNGIDSLPDSRNNSGGISLNNKVIKSEEPIGILNSCPSHRKLCQRDSRVNKITTPSDNNAQTKTTDNKSSPSIRSPHNSIKVDLNIPRRRGFLSNESLSGRSRSETRTPGLRECRSHHLEFLHMSPRSFNKNFGGTLRGIEYHSISRKLDMISNICRKSRREVGILRLQEVQKGDHKILRMFKKNDPTLPSFKLAEPSDKWIKHAQWTQHPHHRLGRMGAAESL